MLLGFHFIFICIIYLNTNRFFYMFSLLDFIIHFFEFFLQTLLLFIFSILLILKLIVYLGSTLLRVILLTKSEISKLSKDADIFELLIVANYLRMSKLGCIVSFKIRELSKKSGNLSDDSKKIIRSWVIVHLKSLYCLVIFDNRVK
jgi:hypothetical protein